MDKQTIIVVVFFLILVFGGGYLAELNHRNSLSQECTEHGGVMGTIQITAMDDYQAFKGLNETHTETISGCIVNNSLHTKYNIYEVPQ